MNFTDEIKWRGMLHDIMPGTEEMLKEALDAAKKSDVILAVVGEATEMSGESASRTDISIPDSQKKLIRALVATGKPVVLVLMSGRPLTIPEDFQGACMSFEKNLITYSGSSV